MTKKDIVLIKHGKKEHKRKDEIQGWHLIKIKNVQEDLKRRTNLVMRSMTRETQWRSNEKELLFSECVQTLRLRSI